jgi:GxxExxY protein
LHLISIFITGCFSAIACPASTFGLRYAAPLRENLRRRPRFQDGFARRGAGTQRRETTGEWLTSSLPVGGFAMHENEIGSRMIEAAIQVHRELGPGLLETVYEVVLARELSDLGFQVERQVPIPILYKEIRFEEGFRADLIIDRKVLLELKSVERIMPAHKKQVQTYLKLTGLRLGYLLNFGEAVLKSGITRCVNGLEDGTKDS